MFRHIQTKHPAIYEKHHTLFSELTSHQKMQLLSLLRVLESVEALEDGVLDVLLEKAKPENYHVLNELFPLVVANISITPAFLASLLSKPLDSALVMAVREAIDKTLLDEHVFTLLHASDYPMFALDACHKLITDDSPLTLPERKTFLNDLPSLEGINDALDMMKRSGIEFSKETFCSTCRALSPLLNNPLIKVIYESRLRVFSDYAEPHDGLDEMMAKKLIGIAISERDEVHKIKNMFDTLVELRITPPTLKYYEETRIDVTQLCRDMLEQYFNKQFAKASSLDEKRRCQAALLRVHRTNALQLFDALKYAIGAQIETIDVYSTRTFDDLMLAIWRAFDNPMPTLCQGLINTDQEVDVAASLASSPLAFFSIREEREENEADAAAVRRRLSFSGSE